MSFPQFKLQDHFDVIKVQMDKAVPDELAQILNYDTTEDAAIFLKSLLKTVESDVVDNESKYSSALDKQYLNVSNWASSSGKGDVFREKYYRFSDEGLRIFFEALFKNVEKNIPATLCRNNLFHCHAVFDEVEDSVDLRLVFHAYEYPLDLEWFKSDKAFEVEPDKQKFETQERNYFKRNAIWSLRNNTLYIPDFFDYLGFSKSKNLNVMPYGCLFDKEIDGWKKTCTIDQSKVGNEIISLNYFPTENVKLFLK